MFTALLFGLSIHAADEEEKDRAKIKKINIR